jgi:hypothetical protein
MCLSYYLEKYINFNEIVHQIMNKINFIKLFIVKQNKKK